MSHSLRLLIYYLLHIILYRIFQNQWMLLLIANFLLEKFAVDFFLAEMTTSRQVFNFFYYISFLIKNQTKLLK